MAVKERAVARSVASGTTGNTLDTSVTFSGRLLWPSWQHPASGPDPKPPSPPPPTPPPPRTGPLEHHWLYKPGRLNMALANPTWTSPEAIQQADYAYDTSHRGTPLPEVEVDLFHADPGGIDFDNYEDLDEFYKEEWNRVERVKALRIKFISVDVIDDEDWFAAGELFFQAEVDGKKTPFTKMLKANSGDKHCVLPWKKQSDAVIEVDALQRHMPIKLRFSGFDEDLICDDKLGVAERELKWPWPTETEVLLAGARGFVARYEIEPVLATNKERSTSKPRKSAEDLREPNQLKLDRARVVSTKTDKDGIFRFRGIAPGDYVLFLRGRLSFIENAYLGGTPDPALAAGAPQHNGIVIRDLSALRGRYYLHLKVRVEADKKVTFQTRDPGGAGSRAFPAVHDSALFKLEDVEPEIANKKKSGAHLDVAERQKISELEELNRLIPFRFYVLPLVNLSNRRQVRLCTKELKLSFNVLEADVEQMLERVLVLDLKALIRWECSDDHFDAWKTKPPIIEKGEPTDAVLKQTLLVRGPAGSERRSVAYDHVHWCFRDPWDTEKARGWFVPLGDEGVLVGPNRLYQAANISKTTYGRYSLRFTGPAAADQLDALDVGELKLRISLWGHEAGPVELADAAGRNDRFDEATRDAVVRFKWHERLYRIRVNFPPAHPRSGDPDPDKCVVSAIVDMDTFSRIDAIVPPMTLADLASTDTHPAYNPAGDPQLTEWGYGRIVAYAVENARRRIEIARGLPAGQYHFNNADHSGFRTLQHNRRVYLGMHQLHWRFATYSAPGVLTPPVPINHNGVNTTVGGTLGSNLTSHAANALVTAADILWFEPRGTYLVAAADYSNHTFGRACDYCYAIGAANHANPHYGETVRDRFLMVRFGASFGLNGSPLVRGRLWIEPAGANVHPAPPGRAPTWIHLDSGQIYWGPAATPTYRDDSEYVLTAEDLAGPRWNATMMLAGLVTVRGLGICAGVCVELIDGHSVVIAQTYTGRDGRYAIQVVGRSVEDGVTMRIRYPSRPGDPHYPAPYPYQPHGARPKLPSTGSVDATTGSDWLDFINAADLADAQTGDIVIVDGPSEYTIQEIQGRRVRLNRVHAASTVVGANFTIHPQREVSQMVHVDFPGMEILNADFTL